MSALADIQDAFQRRLLTGEDGVHEHLADGGPFMNVYDHAYTARLGEVMAKDFPALHALLGDDAFAEAVTAYLAATPSTRPSIRWIGEGLAGWLANTPPWNGHGELSDMAAFEWALGLAFDAPDDPILTAQDLAAIAPPVWPLLRFAFPRAFNVVRLGWDVAPFRQAVAEEREPDKAPAPLVTMQDWAIWRHPETLITHYRPLATDEARALESARDGGTFSDVCEVLATQGAPQDAAARAAGLLSAWVGNGWLSGLEIQGGSL